jgi:hypothetical protein
MLVEVLCFWVVGVVAVLGVVREQLWNDKSAPYNGGGVDRT